MLSYMFVLHGAASKCITYVGLFFVMSYTEYLGTQMSLIPSIGTPFVMCLFMSFTELHVWGNVELCFLKSNPTSCRVFTGTVSPFFFFKDRHLMWHEDPRLSNVEAVFVMSYKGYCETQMSLIRHPVQHLLAL